MKNANGKGYVMISGIDSVMYYDVLNNYIKDTLGYSRIDSIKCVSDTIRIYTNNGQFKMPFSCSGGGGGTDGITQVASVTALRATSGTSTKDIYLKSYWSGLNYGGGRFTWHSTDITGRGDDGGISFAASGGGYWVRNEPEFRATYFGLVDTSDLAAISKTHNTWEAENLTNQITDGSKLVFDAGFTFKTYGGFVFTQADLKTVHIEGYGATLTRCDQIQDSIISNSSSWVRVANPSRWDTFMYVAAYDGTDRMLTNSKITKISGDTLFVSMGSDNYATGDLYTQSYQTYLLKENCTLRGLTFDGNINGNDLYNYWGTCGAVYLSSPNSFINRITVKDSPGEGILLFDDNVILDGFNIQNCNGNGVHTGSNSNYQILNGVIKNVNNLIRRSNIETLGHEGGAIAHSLDVHGGMVSNIQIDSAYAAIADVNGADDSLNVYDRIDAKNCKKAIEFFQGYSQGTASYLKVTNSRFYNCGSFEIKSNPTGPADSSEYVRDIILDNVQLFNTYLDMNARSYNVTMNNIYIEDTSSTTYHIELSKHLKIDGLVKIGGGKIYASECNRAVLQNFEIRETNSTNSAIDFTYSGNALIRNGAIYMTNASSGFVGIYGGVANEISDVFIDLKGSPTYGIFANQSTTQVATTVKNCTILTPLGVPSIRCYGGSSGALFINNKMNNDISNISYNDAYGNINVTNDDVTWGNTTTLEILGKIRDSAGNLGTSGQTLVSDGSGFATWQAGGSGDITEVNVNQYLTGGGTSGAVTIGIDTTGTIGVATKYDLLSLSTGGITDLNGLTAGTQTFATGTSGTDVNISSATSTHTFNFPTASATNRGVLSTTDWTTFNNKWTPSGTTGYVPFFATSSTITSQHDFLTLNTSNAFRLGLGFTSGGNSQLGNYLATTTGAGLVIQDNDAPGIGWSTSTSNRWAMMLNTSGQLTFSRNTGGSWASPYITIGTGGDITATDLAGTGTRLMTASSTGLFQDFANGSNGQYLGISGGALTWGTPTGTATNLTYSGISTTGATLNSSTGTDVTLTAGTGVTFSGTSTNLTINAASSGTTGLSDFIGTSTSIYGGQFALTQSGTTLATINYTNQSGALSMTYSGGGNILIDASGLYELTYSHNVSSSVAPPTTLYSAVFKNGLIINHSIAYTHGTYNINEVYSHTATTIVSLVQNDQLSVRTGHTGSTTASLSVSGATFTIKKLN